MNKRYSSVWLAAHWADYADGLVNPNDQPAFAFTALGLEANVSIPGTFIWILAIWLIYFRLQNKQFLNWSPLPLVDDFQWPPQNPYLNEE